MVPSAPPISASNTLSVIICRTMRNRPAPKAVRSAISFCRPAARTNSRLATFAQAISNTNPTAPKRMKSVGRVFPISCSRSETRRRLHPRFESGYCSSSLAAITSSVGLRLRQRHSRLQLADRSHEVRFAYFHSVSNLEVDRNPQLSCCGEIKALRHDADDGEASAVKNDWSC